jgi:hypothetical protein
VVEVEKEALVITEETAEMGQPHLHIMMVPQTLLELMVEREG